MAEHFPPVDNTAADNTGFAALRLVAEHLPSAGTAAGNMDFAALCLVVTGRMGLASGCCLD